MSSEFFIVGVGASAGGNDAINLFFKDIPTDVPAGFVVVTHLHREFKSQLPEIIARKTSLRVQRISNFMKVLPGTIYVMPENTIATIKNGILLLKPRGAENIINKAIDVFLTSLAQDQKSRAVGVILSGMGTDGSEGALKLFEHGGDVLVQAPESTRFNSMPWATIMKDHPDYILPPQELGAKLVSMMENKIYQQRKKLG